MGIFLSPRPHLLLRLLGVRCSSRCTSSSSGGDSDRRQYAAMKFFIYTVAGSAFLLVGDPRRSRSCTRPTPAYLTFDYRVLTAWALGRPRLRHRQVAVPRRSWPRSRSRCRCSRSTPGCPTSTPRRRPPVRSCWPACILKMGAYGFLRFSFELFPQASVDFAPLLLVLAVIGIIYGVDRRRDADGRETRHRVLVGRAHGLHPARASSRSRSSGSTARVFTMLSHPLTTGALFLVVGMLYERRHTRRSPTSAASGRSAPVLGGALLSRPCSPAIGLPGFSGFIGEFLSLLGTFIVDRRYAVVAPSA